MSFEDDHEYLHSQSPEGLLRELLAALHADGGHHTEEVGLTQSVIDAIEIHYETKNGGTMRELNHIEVEQIKDISKSTMYDYETVREIYTNVESFTETVRILYKAAKRRVTPEFILDEEDTENEKNL